MKGPTATVKYWIVLAINRGPDLCQPTTKKTPENEVTRPPAAEGGYFMTRKSSRGLENEYSVAGRGSRKGTGIINVSFPYYGTTGGTGYVAMEVDANGFVNICKLKMQVDTVRLLEDVSTAAYSLTVQQLLKLEKDYPDQNPPSVDPKGTI